ncbi:MAG TPA: hypothetical protein VI365_13030 [Trebonia sp.]
MPSSAWERPTGQGTSPAGPGTRRAGELATVEYAISPVRRSGLADAIGARTEPVLIPWDCADGFLEAYWRRPEAYLDDHVRRAVSMWTRVGPEAEQRAVRSLRDDLDSSRWAERNRELVDLDAAELGLRLLVA